MDISFQVTHRMFNRAEIKYLWPDTPVANPHITLSSAIDDLYRSPFRNWDRTATVRSRTSATAPEDTLDDWRTPFSPELAPYVDHPLSSLCPDSRHRILSDALLNYFTFTVQLEMKVVIPTAAMCAGHALSALDLPHDMRADAFKIVTDEAWHAQEADGIISRIELSTNRTIDRNYQSALLERFARIREIDFGRQALVELIFTVVSETLISGYLSKLPYDSRLPALIRRSAKEHALDEAKHHAYFSQILRVIWPKLSKSDQAAVGPLVPLMITSFLEPDYRQIARNLQREGIALEKIESILLETYSKSSLLANIKQMAAPTLRYFDEVGVFDHGRARDARKLLIEQSP